MQTAAAPIREPGGADAVASVSSSLAGTLFNRLLRVRKMMLGRSTAKGDEDYAAFVPVKIVLVPVAPAKRRSAPIPQRPIFRSKRVNARRRRI